MDKMKDLVSSSALSSGQSVVHTAMLLVEAEKRGRPRIERTWY
jgi:hypothetical protein